MTLNFRPSSRVFKTHAALAASPLDSSEVLLPGFARGSTIGRVASAQRAARPRSTSVRGDETAALAIAEPVLHALHNPTTQFARDAAQSPLYDAAGNLLDESAFVARLETDLYNVLNAFLPPAKLQSV